MRTWKLESGHDDDRFPVPVPGFPLPTGDDDVQLKTGNWQLATGNWQPATDDVDAHVPGSLFPVPCSRRRRHRSTGTTSMPTFRFPVPCSRFSADDDVDNVTSLQRFLLAPTYRSASSEMTDDRLLMADC